MAYRIAGLCRTCDATLESACVVFVLFLCQLYNDLWPDATMLWTPWRLASFMYAFYFIYLFYFIFVFVFVFSL